MSAAQDDPRPVAIVTGGSGGIGRATVDTLCRDGYRVAVFDLTEMSPGLWKQPDAVFALSIDVTDSTAVARAMEATLARFGRLDALVNNAGLNQRAPSSELSASEWDKVIAVNLTSMHRCTAAALSALRAQNGGAIVNMASVSGMLSVPDRVAYTAAKHGVIGLTKSLAGDLAPDNIRVNAVAPGMIETSMTARYLQSMAIRRKVETAIPLGRVGRPEEIAEAVAFLLSDKASYISGACLTVDGAFSAEKGFADQAGPA